MTVFSASRPGARPLLRQKSVHQNLADSWTGSPVVANVQPHEPLTGRAGFEVLEIFGQLQQNVRLAFPFFPQFTGTTSVSLPQRGFRFPHAVLVAP